MSRRTLPGCSLSVSTDILASPEGVTDQIFLNSSIHDAEPGKRAWLADVTLRLMLVLLMALICFANLAHAQTYDGGFPNPLFNPQRALQASHTGAR